MGRMGIIINRTMSPPPCVTTVFGRLRLLVPLLLLQGVVTIHHARPITGWRRRLAPPHNALAVGKRFGVATRSSSSNYASWLRDLRGGGEEEELQQADDEPESIEPSRQDTTTEATPKEPYHVVSVVSTAPDDANHGRDWLPPGCTVLTSTTATALWGKPPRWQSHNRHEGALMETLALMSDVIVLTVNNSTTDPALSRYAQDALRRGWERRRAQGLTAGRLWIVWTGETLSDPRAWIDETVLQEWTSVVSTDVVRDWQLLHGGPTQYVTALCDLVQEPITTTPTTMQPNLSSMVSSDGLATLLNRVYTTLRGDPSQLADAREPLFLQDDDAVETVSDLPERIQTALLQGSTVEQVPEAKRSAVESVMETPPTQGPSDDDTDDTDTTDTADTADTTDTTDDTVFLQLDQVQALLDDYWLNESPSGLTMPPDFLPTLRGILSKHHRKQTLGADATARMKALMTQHANILRDYYGRLYESLLESGRANTDALKSLSRQYQSAAQRIVNQIRRHVPDAHEMYQNGYQGLQDDAEEIHDRWQSAVDVLFEDDDDDDEGTGSPRRRIPLWLQRLAGRVLVLGVNYVQGWLAWQGVKRAALSRERQMPKFPLF